MIKENGCLIKVYNNEIVDGKFTIPESVTSIEYQAFSDCSSLTSITIGDSVTSIGARAFAYCTSLTSVTIGNSVTNIGKGAFLGCVNLTSVKIPDKVTSIERSAFYNCTGLTSVTIGSGVTSIGNSAFLGCVNLTSIKIPNSVMSIGRYAFSWCTGLTSITIPDSVTSIGSSAFVCCALTSKQANYKAFQIKNGELRCRRKTYSEGKKYYVRGTLKMCENGIHYCTNLFEIFNYYYGELDKDIAIYEIEVGSKVLTSDSNKCCTNSCVLKRRLYREDIIKILNGEEV